MMIKVEAFVREEKFEEVKAALNEIGVKRPDRITRLWAAGCREDIRRSSGECRWICRCSQS